MELVRSQPPDDAQHTGRREKQCAYITRRSDYHVAAELSVNERSESADALGCQGKTPDQSTPEYRRYSIDDGG